jgi:hypothetical protein
MADMTLDANIKGAVTDSLTLTTQTIVSTYVTQSTGDSGNYRLTLEASPDDGVTWFDVGETITGEGVTTCDIVATKVRVKTEEVQKSASTVLIHILANKI